MGEHIARIKAGENLKQYPAVFAHDKAAA